MFDEYGNEIAVLYEKDMFGDIPVKDIYGNLLGTVREGGAMGEPALVDATGQIVGRISGDMTRDAFGAQTSGIISTDMFGDTNVSGSLGGLFDSGADFGEGNETGAPMRSVGVGSVSSSYSGSATNPYSGLEATTDSIIEAIAYGGMPNVEITRKQVSRSENPYLYESAIWYLDELAYWRNRIELLQAEASCAGRTPPNYSLYLAQYRAHEASYEKGLKEAKKRENDPAAMEIWLHEKCIGFIGQKEAAKAAKSQTELSAACENFRKLGKYGYRVADEFAEECIRYINELKYEDAMERIEIAKSKKVCLMIRMIL